jgi:hypothetical protein
VPNRLPPARHELPEIDAAALTTARAVDALLAEARGRNDAPAERWAGYFGRAPDELRDEPVSQLRSVARRARAAYGPKDSIRDVFSPAITEPLLDAIDRLLKALSRYEVHRD